ncbi:T-cell immunoglobulin and mucin domain-containing protein 4 isoform X6 [Marmota marmota marmota]|uniref:T-cell immunoglobulin and mucin domain-containing protein 4 isoform X6 n=1 Tax=Marmota marmota marmota TaxID=9994 RepID=UPI002092D5B6|nr:T-cell immunoglobulin and mucin domain-containing protein 4 isoform X6 [Marmota marmota marmota]
MSQGPLLLWLVMQFGWIYLVPTASEDTVTSFLGQSVTLPCLYLSWSQDRNSMCWGKGHCPNSKCSQALLHTDGSRVLSSASEKYRLLGNIQRGHVSLTISNTNEEDSGVYCCRIEVPGWFNDVKKHIRLVLSRESATFRGSSASWRSIKATSADTASSMAKASEMTSPTQSKSKENRETNLVVMVASCLGFVLLVLVATFLLRGKVTKTSCLQKHKRLDKQIRESKNALNDMHRGQDDEDGLFTL